MTSFPASRASQAREALSEAMKITVRRLESGYYHVRGIGPCNWAQPPHWPCDEETLRAHAFGEAAESFIRAALASRPRVGPTDE